MNRRNPAFPGRARNEVSLGAMPPAGGMTPDSPQSGGLPWTHRLRSFFVPGYKNFLCQRKLFSILLFPGAVPTLPSKTVDIAARIPGGQRGAPDHTGF